MNALKYILGTGFYSGLVPKAPGTAGSLAALLIIFVCIQEQLYALILVFVLLSSFITLWSASYFEQEFGEDPGRMVSDEWAGMGLTFLAISFTGNLQTDIFLLSAGFLFFRLFDILKPLGIQRIQKTGGGWGILADDLLAGFYALICLKTLIFVWPELFGMA